jgi:hypothetical protein
VVVKVPLAETTVENMAKVMPGATLVKDGVDPTKMHVVISTGVGIDLLELAKELRLRPLDKDNKVPVDRSDDFIVPRAATPGALDFKYELENERIFSCEFSGYADEDSNIACFGDDEADPDAT